MKKNILRQLTLILIVFFSSTFIYSISKPGDELPNGPDGTTSLYKNKIVFIMTTPVEAYTVIDEAKPDDKVFIMTAQITFTIDEAIKKEAKGKMEKFDGVIVYGQYKQMEFVKFNNGLGSLAGNGASYPYIYNTKKTGTKYVYFASIPNKPYDVLDTFEKSALGQSGLGVANNAGDPYKVRINSFCEKAVNIAKDKSLDFDAIIVKQSGDVGSDANDFGKEIQIIKFK